MSKWQADSFILSGVLSRLSRRSDRAARKDILIFLQNLPCLPLIVTKGTHNFQVVRSCSKHLKWDWIFFCFYWAIKFWCQIFQKHITSANKKSSQRPGQTSSHWKNRNECSILQYSSIYTHHCVQTILVKNAPWYLDPLIKIRTSNHKLPVQFYSGNIVFKPREERKCTICGSGDVGDEMHYILHCEAFNEERKKNCLALGTTNL